MHVVGTGVRPLRGPEARVGVGLVGHFTSPVTVRDPGYVRLLESIDGCDSRVPGPPDPAYRLAGGVLQAPRVQRADDHPMIAVIVRGLGRERPRR